MSYYYVSTANPATSVKFSLTANFINPSVKNLIISKNNIIEIYTISEHGLIPEIEFSIYGEIIFMKSIEIKKKTMLLVCTRRYDCVILNYEKGKINTYAKIYYGEDYSQPVDEPVIVINPSNKLIVVHAFIGDIRVISLTDDGNLNEVKVMRVQLDNIIDMAFLGVNNDYELVCLSKDYPRDDAPKIHLNSYIISFPEEILKLGGVNEHFDPLFTKLIPIHNSQGLLVCGHGSFIYIENKTTIMVDSISADIISYTYVNDDKRDLIIGDTEGNLYAVNVSGKNLYKVVIERIGSVNYPSSITYLDNSYIYIGSSKSDSQLIRITNSKSKDSDHVEVEEKFQNLAPIVRAIGPDPEKQGQSTIVGCCGYDQWSSIRVINGGVGVTVQAAIELEGVTGLWSLKDKDGDLHKYLVESFISETRVLGLDGNELSENILPKLEGNKPTIHCGNVENNNYIQILNDRILLLSYEGKCFEYNTNGGTIILGSNYYNQILIALTGGIVIYLEVEDFKIVEKARVSFSSDISCLSINPLTKKTDMETEDNLMCDYVSIGLWSDSSIRLLKLPTLEEVRKIEFETDTIPRSTLLITFDNQSYLFIGMGNGYMIHYQINVENMSLNNQTKIRLGTQPLNIIPFHTLKNDHLFISSDHPTIISSYQSKLMYSLVNLKDVSLVAEYHTDVFQEGLTFASNKELIIGTIDGVQKLHIQSYPCEAQARRICYWDEHNCYVCSVTNIADANDPYQSAILLYNDSNFCVFDKYLLEKFETCLSLIITNFGTDQNYLVVGTGFIKDGDDDCKQGRILIFTLQSDCDNPKLTLLHHEDVHGAVMVLHPFQNKLLAGINNFLCLYGFIQKDTIELTVEFRQAGHVLITSTDSHNNYIIVGDMLKSIFMYLYDPSTNNIDEIAKDFRSGMVSCCSLVNDEDILVADIDGNFYSLHKTLDEGTDEGRLKLDITGLYHYGSTVTSIIPGTLVNTQLFSDNSDLPIPKYVFTTSNGEIGIICLLNNDQYNYLLALEKCINEVVHGIGGLEHEKWRKFIFNKTSSDSVGFIDGDLISKYNEIDEELKLNVLEHLNKIITEKEKQTLQSLNQFVDSLNRLF